MQKFFSLFFPPYRFVRRLKKKEGIKDIPQLKALLSTLGASEKSSQCGKIIYVLKLRKLTPYALFHPGVLNIEFLEEEDEKIVLRFSLPFQRGFALVFLAPAYAFVLYNLFVTRMKLNDVLHLALPPLAIMHLNCWLFAGPGYWNKFKSLLTKETEKQQGVALP
jgi:hypothetical protein